MDAPGDGAVGFDDVVPGVGRSAGGVSSGTGFNAGAGGATGSFSSAHAAPGSVVNASASA